MRAAHLIALSLLAGAARAQTSYRVNAGGPAAAPFAADQLSSGGEVFTNDVAIDLSGVVDPAPVAVYRSYRYGYWNPPDPFAYTFPGLTPGARYRVRLHFSDIWTNTQPGQRQFHVDLNGVRVLTGLDVIAETGGPRRALIRELDGAATDAGVLELLFTPISGRDSAMVGGIELLPLSADAGAAQPDGGGGMPDGGQVDAAPPADGGGPDAASPRELAVACGCGGAGALLPFALAIALRRSRRPAPC